MDEQIAKLKAANLNDPAIQGLSLTKITEFFTERGPCNACTSQVLTRLDPDLVTVKYAVQYLGDDGKTGGQDARAIVQAARDRFPPVKPERNRGMPDGGGPGSPPPVLSFRRNHS
jgi:hypothetical protein